MLKKTKLNVYPTDLRSGNNFLHGFIYALFNDDCGSTILNNKHINDRWQKKMAIIIYGDTDCDQISDEHFSVFFCRDIF